MISSRSLLNLVGRSPGEPDRSLFGMEKESTDGAEDAPDKEGSTNVKQRGPRVRADHSEESVAESDAGVEHPPATNPAERPGPPVERGDRDANSNLSTAEPPTKALPQPESKSTICSRRPKIVGHLCSSLPGQASTREKKPRYLRTIRTVGLKSFSSPARSPSTCQTIRAR